MSWIENEVKKEPEETKINTTNVEFTSIKDLNEKRGLKILIYGRSGEGKTHFSLSADAPIFAIDTERGISPLKNSFEKEINVKEIIFSGFNKEDNEVDEVKAFEDIDSAVNTLTQTELKPATIILDSATDLWSYAQSFGKVRIFKLKPEDRLKQQWDWGKINNLHKRIINRLVGCDANVIFTAKSQEEYSGAGMPTGNYKPHCQKNLPYDVDIIIEVVSKIVKTSDGYKKQRYFKIDKCRQKGSIEGQTYDDLSFEKLKEMIK